MLFSSWTRAPNLWPPIAKRFGPRQLHSLKEWKWSSPRVLVCLEIGRPPRATSRNPKELVYRPGRDFGPVQTPSSDSVALVQTLAMPHIPDTTNETGILTWGGCFRGQWGGIYASPMECLGIATYGDFL